MCFIAFHHPVAYLYIYFLASPGSSPLPLLFYGPINGNAELGWKGYLSLFQSAGFWEEEGWGARGCVPGVRCFVTSPHVDFFLLAHDSAQALSNAVLTSCSLRPVVGHRFRTPVVFAGWEPFQVWVLKWCPLILCSADVHSPRSFHLCVERGGNPPVLPSNKFFSSDRSQNESGVDYFFYYYYFYFQFVRLLYLVPLMETKLGVERIYSGGKKKKAKMLFINLPIRSKDMAFYFSRVIRQHRVTFRAPTQLGRGTAT